MLSTETVSSDVDLYVEQINDTSQMRNCITAFDKSDLNAAKKAIQNITVLRVYHQITRIIRYTEMMDKLEDKLYDSINMSLDSMDPADEQTWFKLAALQEKLQRSMIESHKLLEPYLKGEAFTVIETPPIEAPVNSFATAIMDQDSREKLRTSAQEVLAALQSQGEPNE